MEAGWFITYLDYLSIYFKIYVCDSLIDWVMSVCEKELTLESSAATACDELCFCWELVWGTSIARTERNTFPLQSG